jgi:hypothetical protein
MEPWTVIALWKDGRTTTLSYPDFRELAQDFERRQTQFDLVAELTITYQALHVAMEPALGVGPVEPEPVDSLGDPAPQPDVTAKAKDKPAQA